MQRFGALSFPSSKKTKNIHPEKNFLYFRKRNFLVLILKKFFCFLKRNLLLHFLKRKLFLCFWKRNPVTFITSPKNKRILPQENLLYFRKRKLWNANFEKISYIFYKKAFLMFRENKTFLYFIIFQEMETLKTSYISGSNFTSWQNKKFLTFPETELSSPKLKKLLIFQDFRKNFKSTKSKQKYALKKFLVPCNIFIIFTAVKHEEILSGKSL